MSKQSIPTPFGEFMRILRVKKRETMKDTATKLNCSVPFVSAVETGKKAIPHDWYELISKKYSLSDCQKDELSECISASAVYVTFKLSQYTEEQQQEILTLKRKLDQTRGEK